MFFVVLGDRLDGKGPISDGLYQAYNAAESVRTSVISQRQKIAAETDEKQKSDVSDPGKLPSRAQLLKTNYFII